MKIKRGWWVKCEGADGAIRAF